MAENFWQYTDQASRIPNPGDFYVFQFGRAESILIVRGQDNEIRGFYNVCRHRGSRLCRHDADSIPSDPRLSVKQLGQTGNSPVFRCPYHAWTYDTEGSLIYAYGMQDDFDPADNGLLPCHTRVAAGQVFVNLSKSDTPPDFDAAVSRLRGIADKYSLAELKVGAREYYPINANWKLALENFKECYHCGPAHTPLVTTHNWSNEVTPEQREERAAAVAAWVPEKAWRDRRPAAGMGGQGMADGAGVQLRRDAQSRLRDRHDRRQGIVAPAAQHRWLEPRDQRGDDGRVDRLLAVLRRPRRRGAVHAADGELHRLRDCLARAPGCSRRHRLRSRARQGALARDDPGGHLDHRQQPRRHRVGRLLSRSILQPRGRLLRFHQPLHEGDRQGGGLTRVRNVC